MEQKKRTNRADGIASSGGSLEIGDMLFIIALESAPYLSAFHYALVNKRSVSSVVDLCVDKLVSRVQKRFLKPTIQMAVSIKLPLFHVLFVVHENLFLCTISIIALSRESCKLQMNGIL